MFNRNHPSARSLSYKEWAVKMWALSRDVVLCGWSLWETRKILIDNIKDLDPLFQWLFFPFLKCCSCLLPLLTLLRQSYSLPWLSRSQRTADPSFISCTPMGDSSIFLFHKYVKFSKSKANVKSFLPTKSVPVLVHELSWAPNHDIIQSQNLLWFSSLLYSIMSTIYN